MELHHEDYWHLVDRDSFMFFNNVAVGRGFLPSSSVNPLPGAGTLYQLLNPHPEKEALFERVRQERYPGKPTRVGALFCFTSKEDAERANALWFQAAPRDLFRVKIVVGSNFHIADSRHLDQSEDAWPVKAAWYWEGRKTADPFMEVIITGQVFVPDWQDARFPQYYQSEAR